MTDQEIFNSIREFAQHRKECGQVVRLDFYGNCHYKPEFILQVADELEKKIALVNAGIDELTCAERLALQLLISSACLDDSLKLARKVFQQSEQSAQEQI